MAEKEKEQKFKDIAVQIDVDFNRYGMGRQTNFEKSVFVSVASVPEDIPEGVEEAILEQVKKKFVDSLNTATFMGFYDRDNISEDVKPVFFNLKRIDDIEVVGAKILKDIERH